MKWPGQTSQVLNPRHASQVARTRSLPGGGQASQVADKPPRCSGQPSQVSRAHASQVADTPLPGVRPQASQVSDKPPRVADRLPGWPGHSSQSVPESASQVSDRASQGSRTASQVPGLLLPGVGKPPRCPGQASQVSGQASQVLAEKTFQVAEKSLPGVAHISQVAETSLPRCPDEASQECRTALHGVSRLRL
uniref:Uncharacterized protein n=1 Tax=Sphaerodactylus townsendi TaxID=933632 RepID=A0ACB8FMX2_9SAUR